MSWDRGGRGIADNTGILSSFGFREAVGFQALQCCFAPCAPPTLELLSDINIHRLLYFLSSSITFLTWQSATQGSQHCPQNFDTFQTRPSELPGKQQIKNLFSAQHTSVPASQVPLYTLFWLLHPLFVYSHAKYFNQFLTLL